MQQPLASEGADEDHTNRFTSLRARLPSFGLPARLPASFGFAHRAIEITSNVERNCLESNAESCTNAVHTNRFTWYSWLPMSFWLQFRRFANVYFVTVAVLSITPLVHSSPLKSFVVASVMMVQAFKDLYEDRKKVCDDRKENEQQCDIYDGSDFRSCAWKDCRLGSFVKVYRGQKIPADILVIFSSDSRGKFSVSTASLDGETNLKQGFVPGIIQNCILTRGPHTFLQRFQRELEILRLEPAEEDLNSMRGSLSLGQQRAPLDLENFALRGCELRNVGWVIGIACHVGESTKIRMNSSGCATKSSHIEHILNRCVLGILISIVLLSFFFAVLGVSSHGKFIVVFVEYLVMLWVTLPITLYILFEVLHLIFGWIIDSDRDMMDETSEEFARARNTTALEDLGQVSYVFTDKTGTLTANEMHFAFCYVGGQQLGPFLSSADQSGNGEYVAEAFAEVHDLVHGESDLVDHNLRQKASLFFRMLAVCHNVQLERDDDDSDYLNSFESDKLPSSPEELALVNTFQSDRLQAASPDELALVLAARHVGFSWSGREMNAERHEQVNTLKLKVEPADKVETIIVSHEIPFSSERKRMSVIIRQWDGSALVWSKGADSVMRERLEFAMPTDAEGALMSFALQGLRTLVLGYKCMDQKTFEDWQSLLKAALAIQNKQERERDLEEVYCLAESKLTFVGITAVEDRLQDQVPETIAKLRSAGVRVWVLTGDKTETAVEIAKSCKLFECEPQRDHYVISHAEGELHEQEIRNTLSRALESSTPMHLRGLVLDGRAVSTILGDPAMRKDLYCLATKCISCVCCRLSPLQKKQLVEMVRCHDSSLITLAIGDGGNDVPMIQGAHVGIGIRGKEGSASVLASDVAISQFKFLQKLMFVHGRKAYRRVALFLGYFLYKSVALGGPYIVHAFLERFNGDAPFAASLDVVYAPLTSWSAALMVAFNKDAGDHVSNSSSLCDAMREPHKFYVDGPQNNGFNLSIFSKCMFTASVHGLTVWLLAKGSIANLTETRDHAKVYWIASFNAFTCLLTVVHTRLWYIGDMKLMKLFQAPRHKQNLGAIALILELLTYILGCIALSGLLGAFSKPRTDSGGPFAPNCHDCTDGNGTYVNVAVPFEAFKYWQFWVCNIGIPLLLLLFDMGMRKVEVHLERRTIARAIESSSSSRDQLQPLV